MVAVVVALFLLVMAAPALAAKPGALDRSFGVDGRVDVPTDAFVPRAVGVDGENRIVVGGYLCDPDPASADGTCLDDGSASFRIARLTPDGGLDADFGERGFVTTPVGEDRSQAFDLIVRRDGRIIAAGSARTGGRQVFALAAYDSSGMLDPSFGDGGIALAAAGTSYASLGDVALGPGATIIAAGQAVDDGGTARMAVARFEPDGDLDPTFGNGGVTLGGTGYGYGFGVASRPGGATMVAGAVRSGGGYRFGELRVTSRGWPDASFDGDGFAEQPVGASASFANALVSAPGGWVAAGAAARGGHSVMAAVRGLDDGSLAGDFGGDGSRTVPLLEGAVANDVVMDGDRPLLIGQAMTAAGGYAFAAVRLTARGRPDRDFAGDGAALVRWPEYPIARAMAGTLQDDGKLVTVGFGCSGGVDDSCTGGTARLLVARQHAGVDRTAPAIRVGQLARRVSVRRLRGLRLRIGLSEPGRVTVRLSARKRQLWRARRRGPARSFTLRVKGDRATLRRLRGSKLRLRVRATDLEGNAATRRITLSLRK